MNVEKHGYFIPVSDEVFSSAQELRDAVSQFQKAAPAEREQWVREAAATRAAERAQHPHQALTVEVLIEKLGWTPEYASHFVQPYCDCEVGMDGWEYCQHSRDEGV